MTASTGTIAALAFFWLGMVAAISFLEAPLKFRAPDVTPTIGLGIGRLVFRALNTVEAVLGLAIVVVATLNPVAAAERWTLAIPVVALAAQLVLVRPRLTRRSDLVLAGQDAPHSRAHHAYIALEVLKVTGLLGAGIMLISS